MALGRALRYCFRDATPPSDARELGIPTPARLLLPQHSLQTELQALFVDGNYANKTSATLYHRLG